MHLQTATSATTATMAYPTLPASPTLTNPDMILPYGDEYDSPPSRPLSPDNQWGGSKQANMQFSIGPPMGPLTPTTPIIYGNGTMLSDIGEVTEAESTPGRRLPGPAERRMLKQQAQNNSNARLRSSPTLGGMRSSPTVGYDAVMKRAKTGTHQRTVSIESTSTVTSEGQSAEIFKDFDDGISVDDSNFQGDDEESVADSYSYSQEVIAQETQRLSNRNSMVGVDEDGNSSAALSRRAEQILLNAKRRLNNMEGNLTRARSTLHKTASGSLSSIHSSSPLSRSTPSPPQSGGLTSHFAAPPSMHRQIHASSNPMAGSPGHSRVYSENSISPNMRTPQFPARSTSAAARYIGKGGTDVNQRSPTSPQDSIREESNNTPTPRVPSSRTSPPNRTSPPHAGALEPLGEDETLVDFEADRASIQSSADGHLGPSGDHRGLTRSASSMQMRDIRDQMHDLKGRLSVLRDRARDDTMKRRSLQSLRTPSPFTAAEQWYTAAKGYGEGGLSADAGVAHPPWNQESQDTKDINVDANPERLGHEEQGHAPEYAASDVTSVYEDVNEELHSTDLSARPQEPRIIEEKHDGAKLAGKDEEQNETDEDDYNDEIVNREEVDDYESDASSYHDTVTTAISHEDREDAFDYEHFFLHSAMGTISRQRNGRRESFSSDDSVETTRGPTTQTTGGRPISHIRNSSNTSVSTFASFATATEGRRSVDLRDEDRGDFAVQHIVAPERDSSTPVSAKRLTFGDGSPIQNGYTVDRQSPSDEMERPPSVIHDRKNRDGTSHPHKASVASLESSYSEGSTGSARSFPLVNKAKSSQSLTPNGSRENEQGSPVHMLAQEDQILVEKLVASLGKCVLGLSESGRESYDSRVWKRRLDAARRVLDGEEGAI
ncbi:hypothetical protein LHYA1_G003961 [Lachnellula hyalina]|uniref:Uncharacterized protein n=1 Tax=Lachnellula hyalina TaxID=1316788 RepID=A0A8H8R2M4_9HELO|nr:uncharacterized protein LHYA1_G003961 [Lachnellula hyalina]TVY26541.1 hypothetical protein LHYA1_G003961 [Lachnellula hyalina]